MLSKQSNIASPDDLTRHDGDPADSVASDDCLADHGSPYRAADPMAEVMALLDADELMYFQMNQLEGKTRSRIARELAWPMVRIERTRRRLNLHLAKLRRDAAPLPMIRRVQTSNADTPDLERVEGRFRVKPENRIYSFSRGSSLNPFFKERLAGGLSVWQLSPVSSSQYLKFPNLPIVEAPALKGKVMTIDQQLKVEQKRLERITERLHCARLASETAGRELQAVRGEFSAEMAKAVLEERAPAADPILKKIAQLETAVDVRKAELEGAAEAHRQQAAVVERIEGDIILGRKEKFLSDTKDDRAEIRAMIEALGAKMAAYSERVVAAGVVDDYDVTYRSIFPVIDIHSFAGPTYQNLALHVGFAALKLHHGSWEKIHIQSAVA